jgi:phospho-N-acetylmuramoyl-pentapeptide-transferase
MITAFVLSLIVGPWLIKKLRQFQCVEQCEDQRTGALDRAAKVGTPTLGGLLILSTSLISTLLWAVPGNFYVLCAVGTFIFMGALGFADDILKLHRGRGLSSRSKLLGQGIWAVVFFLLLASNPETFTRAKQLMVPFLKEPLIVSMGSVGAFGFLLLVLVGASNAVNLTDGLDGLAIGCISSAVAAFLVMAYVAGHYSIAEYLQIPFVKGSGELAVFCGALFGAGLGFLWFNCHPAQLFMGDTGSLALGGALAAVAILIKQELVLILVGGVFVAEALSVLLQVASAQWTRRFSRQERRIFYRAPLHHHFEHIAKQNAEQENRPLGAAENRIVIRFWVLSFLFALLGVATLKLR